MPWLSNLPISEAQKIEGSAHHGHTSHRNFVLGQCTTVVSFSTLSFPITQSKHFSSKFLSPKSSWYYPNLLCLWPHTIVLLLLCHLPTTLVFFTILAAVMFDRRIVKASFSEGTFSKHWLRTGITLKTDGISSKNFQGINFGLCGTHQGSYKIENQFFNF